MDKVQKTAFTDAEIQFSEIFNKCVYWLLMREQTSPQLRKNVYL
jgi:hypothetical protein